MSWFTTSVKIGVILSLLVIMLLSGCAIAPSEKSGLDKPEPLFPPKAETTVQSAPRSDERIIPPISNDVGIPVEIPIVLESTPIISSPPLEELSIAELPTIEPTKQERTHIVQPGENLYSIARDYEQNFRDIVAWNKLTEPYQLSPGQVLVVSSVNNALMPLTKKSPLITRPQPIPTLGNRNYHIVLPGDNLYKLAKHYGCRIGDIAKWNDLHPPYILSIGQRLQIILPDANSLPSSQSQKTLNTNHSDYHVVAPQETLYGIARRYDQSVSNLATWNHLEYPYKNLSVGQKLRVVPPTTREQIPNSNTLRPNDHIVKSGETLSGIANKYGLSLSELAKRNGIGSPYTIYPGLKLTVSPP